MNRRLEADLYARNVNPRLLAHYMDHVTSSTIGDPLLKRTRPKGSWKDYVLPIGILVGVGVMLMLGGCQDAGRTATDLPKIDPNAAYYEKLAPYASNGLYKFYDTKDGNVCYIYINGPARDAGTGVSCLPDRNW